MTAADDTARRALAAGRALAAQGRDGEAVQAFAVAIATQPDFIDAHYEYGSALQRLRRLDDAQASIRHLLTVAPGHAPAQLALGSVLIEAGQPARAEVPLRAVLASPAPPRLKAMAHVNLGLALRQQRKDAQALVQYEQARAVDPSLPGMDTHLAEAQQNLKQYDAALATYRAALVSNPADPELHRRLNDLLYRLRDPDYLASYDAAPNSRALLLGKARFLAQEKRGEESLAIHRVLLAQDSNDIVAAAGMAEALVMLKRPCDALATYDAALAKRANEPILLTRAAEAALLAASPDRALDLCRQALAIAPHDQAALATLGTTLRLLDDPRDEDLSGYDSLIAVFDLEPPQGFSSMEDFNAELNASLDRLHPDTREHLHQSLRGGTQTPDHVFGAGHDLIDRLQVRINEAVARHIAALPDDGAHPFLARRGHGFRYSGSWSSRLRDCGFHVNHIHPQGWISSCYYIAVPAAVRDEEARQGWIKFGEPGLDVALKNPIRRAIQPAPGRLVLFPSYLWHGTIPFHDAAARTTIAFDVVPQG